GVPRHRAPRDLLLLRGVLGSPVARGVLAGGGRGPGPCEDDRQRSGRALHRAPHHPERLRALRRALRSGPPDGDGLPRRGRDPHRRSLRELGVLLDGGRAAGRARGCGPGRARVMAAPRLTVVIPVYNEERILPSALADLTAGLDGRRLDYEVLLAENGSTDGTQALLERLTRENPRLRWFHCSTPNYGAALKQGMLEARGELVFCDEIDLCDPRFYDRAIELLRAPSPDMVV